MIILILFAVALCAQAAVPGQNAIGQSVEAHLGPQELHFQVGSTEINEDNHLSTLLEDREKTQGRNLVANAIAKALEDLREVVINGNEVLPPLDPLQIAHIGPFEHRAPAVRVNFNVHNFQLEGLRWYLVDRVTFNTLRLALSVKITVPWLIFTGNYDAYARVALLSHRAGGNYRIFINRLETSLDLRLGTNILSGRLFLRQLDINIVIHDINIQIDGMVGSSLLNNMINGAVQGMAQNLLRDELEAISQMISREVFEVVNEFLANFTLEDLLG